MSKRLARHAVLALAVVIGTASSLALSTRSDAGKPPGQDPPPTGSPTPPALSPPVTISAETPGVSGPRSIPVSVTIARCFWQLADDQSILGHETWPYTDTQGRTWHLYRRDCGSGIEWTSVVDQPPGDLVDQAIADLQTKILPLPTPTFIPYDDHFQWSIVKVPLDIRVTPDTWRPYLVSATNGLWTITVTATPRTLTFDPGEHHNDAQPPITCGGTDPVAAYEPNHPGACSYTYLHASSTSRYDGYHFLTTTTLGWTVTWIQTDTTGTVTLDTGTRPDLITTTQTPLGIAEIQAILCQPGTANC